MLSRPAHADAAGDRLGRRRGSGRSRSRPSVIGGSAHDESPEWMPASSMCSITPPRKSSSPSKSASTSISTASSRNRSTSTGWRGADRRSARARCRPRARRRRRRSPCRGRRGRTTAAPAPGSRSRAAIRWASGYDVAMPCFGAGSPASASTRPNAPRSSARWIASGGVPTIGTPASLSPCARPSGVWPPSWQIDAGDRAGLLLGVHDLEHVLERQRLEVEPVGGVVVGARRSPGCS